MRTTLIIDPDVEQLLKQSMHEEKLGLKAALNAALRRGLVHQKPALPLKPFRVEAKAMGLRPGFVLPACKISRMKSSWRHLPAPRVVCLRAHYDYTGRKFADLRLC